MKNIIFVLYAGLLPFGALALDLSLIGSLGIIRGECPFSMYKRETPYFYWTDNATLSSSYKKLGETEGCFEAAALKDTTLLLNSVPVCAVDVAPSGIGFYDDKGNVYEFTRGCAYDGTSSGTGGYYKMAAKCIALPSASSGFSCSGAPSGTFDWTSNCSIRGTSAEKNLKLIGIARCSYVVPTNTKPGEYVLDDADVLQGIHGQPSKWCYCKVVAPFETKWILGSEYINETDCNNDCAGFCAYATSAEDGFRTAIFLESNFK